MWASYSSTAPGIGPRRNVQSPLEVAMTVDVVRSWLSDGVAAAVFACPCASRY
jgi:hypothetical protein